MALNVYYSVGQNTTDHKTGSPTVTIVSGVATFSVAQTALNMGVGDRVTYNTSTIAYIASKTSPTVWNLVTALGAAAPNVSGQTVNSIAHEYTSLSAAEAGASDANHINNVSLVAADVILNIPCYFDTGEDTTRVIVDGYTTDATRFIKIYTPFNIWTECNQSQRHNGFFGNSQYIIRNSADRESVIALSDPYVTLEGLCIHFNYTAASDYLRGGIGINAAGTNFTISSCIIKASGLNAASGNGIGIGDDGAGPITVPGVIKNCIIYGFTSASAFGNGSGIYSAVPTTSPYCYAYNCTVYNCNTGFVTGGGDGLGIINCMAISCTTAAYNTSFFRADSDYNFQDTNVAMATNPVGGEPAHNIRTGTTGYTAVRFKNTTAGFENFLLQSYLNTDNKGPWKDGTNLTSKFNNDIRGLTRPTSGVWDIGADQFLYDTLWVNDGILQNNCTTGSVTKNISLP